MDRPGPAPDLDAPGALPRWVLATWGGWLLGLPIVVALALAGEAVGVGGAQFVVGAGMGLGVGLGQARAVRRRLGRASPWIWSSTAGLCAPFLATDLLRDADWSQRYSLYACVALGGAIVGTWQALLLRRRFLGAGGWAAASVAGWTLAAGAAAAADVLSRSLPLRGVAGALAYLAVVASGGLVLGLVTGLAFVRLPRQSRGS